MKIGLSIWMFVPDTGGLYKHARDLALALKGKGHEVTVVTRASTFLPQGQEFLFRDEPHPSNVRDGIEIRHLRYPPRTNLLRWFIMKAIHRDPLQGLALNLHARLAKASALDCFRGCDVIQHAGQATALVGFAAERTARSMGVPFLVQPTCHPFQFGDEPLDHVLFRRADRLLVHTEYEAGHFRNCGYRMPIDVVGNGIEDRNDGDPERFRKAFGIEGPLILHIGRKDPDKGYPLVVEAFQKVQHAIPDASLVCIGPRGTSKVAPTPGVHDLEFVSEQTKHDALAACSCLCVPSEGESFGLVFMEAGRYGKPIVARKLPVLVELLGNKYAGLLLGMQTGNENHVSLSVEELSDGLVDLLRSPEQCSRLGEKCRKVSENFIWPNIVNRFTTSYADSLARR